MKHSTLKSVVGKTPLLRVLFLIFFINILSFGVASATTNEYTSSFDFSEAIINSVSNSESMERSVGGAEIQLAIIDDGCQGQVGILSIEFEDEVTYLWSTGETTETIMITENGTYSVIVTIVGTTGTYTDSIEVTELNPTGAPFSGYTILGQKDVKLHKFNTVLSGAVGATDSNGTIELKQNTNVFSFVQAHGITIDNSSYADDVIHTPAEMELPEFVYNPYSDSKDDVRVNSGETLTITGHIYRKIEVEKNGKLIIDTDNLFARELKLKKESIVEFTGCTNVILSNNGLKLHQDTQFNPTGMNVDVYSDHNVEIDQGSLVIANIYANDHQIHAKGKNGNPTSMIGFFSAWKVNGQDWVNWEFGNLCSPCPVIFPEPTGGECDCNGGMTQLTILYTGGSGANLTVNSGVVLDNNDGTYTINTASGEDKLEKNFEINDGQHLGEIHTSCSRDILGVTFANVYTVIGHVDRDGHVCVVDPFSNPLAIEDIPIIAYPNPTKTSFNLYVQSQKDLNDIKVTVFSITNQKVMDLTISSNTTYSIGEKLQPGFYLVRVETEDQVKILKVIKN